MRILNLSPYVPWPLNGGPAIRIYHVLRELTRLGNEVTLLAGHEGPPLPASHPLRSLCREIVTYVPPASARHGSAFLSALRSLASPSPYVAAKFGSPRITEAIRRITSRRDFDLIWANFAFMASAVPPEFCRTTPVVLDEHESEGLLWRQYLRQGTLPKRAFAVINLAKLPRFQTEVFSRASAVVCNSEREASFTRRYAPPRVNVWAVPNGVDTDAFTPTPTEGKKNIVLMCGGYAVYRNRAAARWFAEQVLPMVRRDVPDAEFWIVGSHPNQEIWDLAKRASIRVTGTVDDVRPYYAEAKVAIAPYRYGEGTKIKVVEAMACGTPLVSTPTGCQGLDVVDGQHILIADTEEQFASRVTQLLRNNNRAQALASEARELAVRKFSWKHLISALEQRLSDLAQRANVAGNQQTGRPESAQSAC